MRNRRPSVICVTNKSSPPGTAWVSVTGFSLLYVPGIHPVRAALFWFEPSLYQSISLSFREELHSLSKENEQLEEDLTDIRADLEKERKEKRKLEKVLADAATALQNALSVCIIHGVKLSLPPNNDRDSPPPDPRPIEVFTQHHLDSKANCQCIIIVHIHHHSLCT